MSSFLNLFASTSDEPNEEQQEQRPRTRSQTRTNASSLQLPQDAVASFNGVARGRRSPSPLNVGYNANSAVIFAYDSTNISQRLLQPHSKSADSQEFADADDDSSAEAATADMATPQATIAELRASAAAAVEAANAATAALAAAASLVTQQQVQQPSTQIRTRKPDLPEFDSKNVEIWIRRVQAAYDRAAIVLPKDKFAFLESRFAVGANPTIDAYLYGPATEESWHAFLSYLKEEYGRTVRQEAQYLRGQFHRDGRKPSQMLAQIKDKAKRVTVDDILKEIVVSALPNNVQHMILERVKDLTAEETAAIADRYFDQDGRPLNSSAPSVQVVDAPKVETTHEDDDNDNCEINAIGGRRGNGRGRHRGNNNNFTRPFSDNGFQGRNNNNKTNRNVSKLRHGGAAGTSSSSPSNLFSTPNAAASHGASSKAPLVCMNHQRFGDRSYNCQQGCTYWPEFQQPQAGNGQAGRRK